MAKAQKVSEAVTLTSPTGTKVTVSKESVDKYKAKGYKAASAARSSS